jgi:signal transduction histidine kinase
MATPSVRRSPMPVGPESGREADRSRSWSDYLAASSGRRVAWLVVVAAAVSSLALTGSLRGRDGYDVTTVLEFLVGCSFVVSGLVAWSRRENRLGPLMVVVGLTWLARPLINVDSSLVFTGAIWLLDTWFLLFALFLLSLPYGRLSSRLDAMTMGVFLLVAFPLEFAWLSFFETGAPGNAALIWPDSDIADKIDWVQRSLVVVGSAGLTVTLWHRWISASAPLRRVLIPALVGGVAVLLSATTTLSTKFTAPPQEVRWAELCAFIAVPVAVLISMLRARLARSAVGELMVELRGDPAPVDIRDALARALRDPSLTLAYWLSDYESYTDLDGRAVIVPATDGRATTLIDHNGSHVAALLHDRALEDEPELLSAVGAAASIALENARLQAELVARLEEVKGSRIRVIEAGESERKRLERDLHDGAQQRLIALSLELKRLEKELADDSASRQLDEAQDEITRSLDELRAVARGLHPAVLTGHGLGVALEQVAARAPVPVRLSVEIDGRLPEQIEIAAYYVVAESLTNIAKHSQATSASVHIARNGDDVVVEIVDDGIGGADSERGSGLRGLADRVEALGGRLRVWTPHGGGTRVQAEIPCV